MQKIKLKLDLDSNKDNNISMLKVPFIIADIGSNWARYTKEELNFKYALHQIREAANLGVSAVKFQLFTHQELYGYEDKNSEINFFSLPKEWVPQIKKECDKNNVEFMCTAFSPKGIDFIDQYVNIHKLASSELTYRHMYEKLKKTRKPFIVSTGGAYEFEIPRPSKDVKMILMQCVSSYPALIHDYNLSVLNKWLEKGYKMVGISDHTLFEHVALISIGAGASVFEKHFDVCDTTPYGEFHKKVTPDQRHSLKPEDFEYYVKAIKDAYISLGDGIKKPVAMEELMLKKHKRRYIKDYNGMYRIK